MRMKKSRSIITVEAVLTVFDDARVAGLAKIAKLARGADIAAFAAGIRDAARIFALDARIPTGNELHNEIARLCKAADRRQHEQVARLLERLSPQARDVLNKRGTGFGVRLRRRRSQDQDCDQRARRPAWPSRFRIKVPSPDALRDAAQCEKACAAVATLCQFGGRYVGGPPSKGSRPQWRPALNAPEPRRNSPKRQAERYFVMLLSIAWNEATGATPPRVARHRDGSRDVGPFARFVRECLRLVGAPDADVVELINELHRRRCEMERRTSERAPIELLSGINP